MRPYAHLLFAVFVLQARAATIPDQIQPETEKELISDDLKSPIENISSEQELIDQANTIKDVQNNLRNNVAEDIPVEIILEEVQPTLKTNVDQETVNEVSNEQIQRLVVDLNNPGPPQRQEHETQNPEHYEDAERTVITVKEDVKETQTLLRQGFQAVTDGIQNLAANNENLNSIQISIQNMRENFISQIQKLNETLQNFLNPDKLNPNANEKEISQIKANYAQIESRLKILQNNFDNGVRTLSEGVQVVATLRDDASSEAPTSSVTGASNPSTPGSSDTFNPFIGFITNLQTSLSNNFAGVSQAISNYFTSNQNLNFPNIFSGSSTTASPPSDTTGGSSTTAQPTGWQNFQAFLANPLNLNQVNNQGGQTTPTEPFQNFPFIQNVVNLIQPNRPGAQSPQKPTATSTQGSSAKPSENKPEPEKTPEPEKKPEQSGPIRQLLENNPVVQSISGTVQRIQSTINNPEKPRETEGKNETELEKGGVIFLSGHGGGGNGDNNDSGSRLTADEINENIKEDKDEVIKGTEPVPEKTE